MEKKYIYLIILILGIIEPCAIIRCILQGNEVSFAMTFITIVEIVLLIIFLTNKLTGRFMNENNRARLQGVRKTVRVLSIIIALCVIPTVWTFSAEGNKTGRKSTTRNYYSGSYQSYSSSNTYSGSSSSYSRKSKKICRKAGCNKNTTINRDYCYSHTCKESSCQNGVYLDTSYCSQHQPEKSSTQKPYSSSRNSSSKSKKEDDEYGVNNYSDEEDFYYDNYDDFESYEDAEDYYNEYVDE